LFLFSGDERMSSSPVYENLQYRDVAVLVAVASVKARSLAMISRLTNPATFLYAMADAVRIVRDDIVFSGKPTIAVIKDEKGNPAVVIKSEGGEKPVIIRGCLPSAEAVRRFIEEASVNIEVARKVAAHALHLLVEADESRRSRT
jgi:CRISPR type I-A-associated protein Csa5